MKLFIASLDDVPNHLEASAISIGNFDGVHLGHQRLIEQLIEVSAKRGIPSIVVTFNPPPAAVLYPDTVPPALTWIERRAELLHSLGVDIVVALPTDIQLLSLSAEDFFHQILLKRLKAKAIVEGPNFRFGKNRLGDIDMLERLCLAQGLEFQTVSVIQSEGDWISSSRIRKLIVEGEMASANRMMTQPYRIAGRVGSGAGRGTGLGFPTANLFDIQVLVPAHGVYAGRGSIEQKSYPVAIHIGPNPTFGESNSKVEAHFIGAQLDLVGKRVELEILERIRTVRKFESIDLLREQLHRDLAETRRIASL